MWEVSSKNHIKRRVRSTNAYEKLKVSIYIETQEANRSKLPVQNLKTTGWHTVVSQNKI